MNKKHSYFKSQTDYNHMFSYSTESQTMLINQKSKIVPTQSLSIEQIADIICDQFLNSVAEINKRLEYSNVFSLDIQMHPLMYAGLTVPDISELNGLLSRRIGMKTFFIGGELFCQCLDYEGGDEIRGVGYLGCNIAKKKVPKYIGDKYNHRGKEDNLPVPKEYTDEDAVADSKMVIELYRQNKSTLDNALYKYRRVRLNACKMEDNQRRFSMFSRPTNLDELVNSPLRINQLNFDCYIREDQWKRRVAPLITSQINIPWVEIQGIMVHLGDVALTVD